MKNLIIIVTGLAVFAAGLGAAGALTPRINRERQEQNLMVSDTVYDLPPEMAVAQAALGTFRGIAVNALWDRADRLKNEGKFYEAIELGKLITKLQPRYPKVWEFVSWNLAYNIAVATHTPEERWIWVKSGIDMLQSRGGGIDANPNELSIYQQLGWIYFHKIGEFMDNMSWHYKRELADIWHSILGNPPRSPQEYLRWLDQVVNAPERVEDLPEGGRRLAVWLRENQHAFDRHTLRRFMVPTVLEEAPPPSLGAVPGLPNQQASRVVPQLFWPDWATAADVEAVVNFIRKKAITSDELNMDPVAMRRMAERFGPLDWRHPATHCLYWSQLGLERLTSDEGRQLDNEINTERNVLNALEAVAHSGQVVYHAAPEAADSYISYLPAWNFWLSYDAYFQSLVDSPRQASQFIERDFGFGHRNKMDIAIATAFAFGDNAAADMLYRRMHEKFQNEPVIRPEYEVPLEDFAFYQFQKNMEQPQIIRGLIVGLLTQSMTDSILHRNAGKAELQYRNAKQIYDKFRELNPNPNDPLFDELPPFEWLNITATASFIGGSAGPAGVQRVPLDIRAGVYAEIDPRVQALVWLQSGPDLAAEAASEGYLVEELFPPPPQDVMERVRQQLLEGSRQQPGAEARPDVR